MIAGFAPLLCLANHLVTGAVGPNVLAQSLLAGLGPLRLDGADFYAGSTRLNGNTEIVDQVLAETGYGCTAFARDVRVATTASELGSTRRALGTRANATVTRVTLKGGREFRGTTRTIGKDWAIVYRRLRDSGRATVGMLATFCEVSAHVFPLLDPAAMLVHQ